MYGGTAGEMARLINDSGVLGDTMTVTERTVNDVSFDKMIEAIHVIQEEMGLTGTTAKEAAGTISGSAGSMKAAWENLMVEIAKDDGNISQKIDEFAASAETAFDNTFKRIEKSLDGLGQLIEKTAPIITEKLPILLETVLPDILKMGASITLSIGKGIIATLPEIISSGGDIVSSLLNGITKNIPRISQTVSKVIANISTWLNSHAGEMIKAGMDMIRSIAQGLVENLPDIIDSIIEILTFIGEVINDNLPMILEMTLQIITAIGQGIMENLPMLVESALQIITTLAQFLSENLSQMIPAIVGIILEIVDTLTQPDTLSTLVDAAIAIVVGLADGIINSLPELVKRLPEIVDNIVTGIVDAVPKLLDAAIEIIAKLGEYLTDPNNLLDILDAGLEIIATLVKGIGNAFKSLWGIAKDIVKEIADHLPFGDAIQWGIDLVSNLVDGIKSAYWKVEEASEGLGEKIYDWLHHSTPEKGPLKDDDKWGGDLVDNIVNGMLDRKNALENAAKSLAEGINTGFDPELEMSASINGTGSSISLQKMNGTPVVIENHITIHTDTPDEEFKTRFKDAILEVVTDARLGEIIAQGGTGW